MNPWLELHWGSTHLRLIVYTADKLNECLPDDLVARIESPEAGERYIQILGSARQRPVTIIQFLSPEIRDSEESQKAYKLSVKRLLALGSSLVEVDLVRDRGKSSALPLECLPASMHSLYRVCVHHAWHRPPHELYAMSLCDRLPVIRLPLREADDFVLLDFQDVVNRVYLRSNYGRRQYAAELEPPLEPDDAKWADQLLREKGLR